MRFSAIVSLSLLSVSAAWALPHASPDLTHGNARRAQQMGPAGAHHATVDAKAQNDNTPSSRKANYRGNSNAATAPQRAENGAGYVAGEPQRASKAIAARDEHDHAKEGDAKEGDAKAGGTPDNKPSGPGAPEPAMAANVPETAGKTAGARAEDAKAAPSGPKSKVESEKPVQP